MSNMEYYECGCHGYEDDLAHCKKHKGESMETEFVTNDSGQRQEFSSGMRRDVSEGKARYDLVYLPMFKRWAELMSRGAVKYGENNWQKAGTQEELKRFKESAFRHFIQWFNNENLEEDHAAAVLFNISGAEYVQGKLNNV